MKIIDKLKTNFFLNLSNTPAEANINGKTEISHKSYHNPSRLDKSNA